MFWFCVQRRVKLDLPDRACEKPQQMNVEAFFGKMLEMNLHHPHVREYGDQNHQQH